MNGRSLVVAGALAAALLACGGDADPTNGDATAPANTGVTFPDTVPDSVADDSTAASTATTNAPAVVTERAPRGFPSDFPRPEGAEVVFGSEATVGDDRVLSIDLRAPGSVASVLRFYRGALDEPGFAVLVDENDDIRFETDDYVGDVLVAEDEDDSVLLTLTATLPAG